ncbi:hypothetical protein B0H19DRAFT_1258474 [Mycena capillaripes]|nr:hypothetical protein B0H19DRAFT_1258474 [Mycena capillaripes]
MDEDSLLAIVAGYDPIPLAQVYSRLRTVLGRPSTRTVLPPCRHQNSDAFQSTSVPSPQTLERAFPLFNGLIPHEIRNTLLAVILAEYTPSDHSLVYPPSVRRPGQIGPRTINVVLLRTCRRIYVETYHLPRQLATRLEVHYFTWLARWRLHLVREVKLFTQMFWLAQSFAGFCASSILLPITEGGRLVVLSEYIEDIAREKREVIRFAVGGQGCALHRLPALRVLEMEFETRMKRKEELKEIVKRALKWRFSMGERGVLSDDEWMSDEESFCVFTVGWEFVENTE